MEDLVSKYLFSEMTEHFRPGHSDNNLSFCEYPGILHSIYMEGCVFFSDYKKNDGNGCFVDVDITDTLTAEDVKKVLNAMKKIRYDYGTFLYDAKLFLEHYKKGDKSGNWSHLAYEFRNHYWLDTPRYLRAVAKSTGFLNTVIKLPVKGKIKEGWLHLGNVVKGVTILPKKTNAEVLKRMKYLTYDDLQELTKKEEIYVLGYDYGKHIKVSHSKKYSTVESIIDSEYDLSDDIILKTIIKFAESGRLDDDYNTFIEMYKTLLSRLKTAANKLAQKEQNKIYSAQQEFDNTEIKKQFDRIIEQREKAKEEINSIAENIDFEEGSLKFISNKPKTNNDEQVK